MKGVDGASFLGKDKENGGNYLMVSNAYGKLQFPGKLIKIHIHKLHSRLTESESDGVMLRTLYF